MKTNTLLSLIIFACYFTLGCESSNDSPEISEERTITKMEISSAINYDDYDWNDAKLVFNQSFDESYFIEDNWFFENNETNPDVADQLQNYSKKNVEVNNGSMKIFARKIGSGDNRGDYTSARISAKFAIEYGRIEFRAKLPQGEKNGIWAKLALIGNNGDKVGWPDSGEIDFMEYFSHRPNETYLTVHTGSNNSANNNLITHKTILETAEEEFHNYGILWTNESIKFYIDNPDNIIYTLERPPMANNFIWPFDQPFYPLIDLVVGGQNTGDGDIDDSMFPAVLEIEYIRVYHAQ